MGEREGELSAHSTLLQHVRQRGVSAPEGVSVPETRTLSSVIWASHPGHSAPLWHGWSSWSSIYSLRRWRERGVREGRLG